MTTEIQKLEKMLSEGTIDSDVLDTSFYINTLHGGKELYQKMGYQFIVRQEPMNDLYNIEAYWLAQGDD